MYPALCQPGRQVSVLVDPNEGDQQEVSYKEQDPPAPTQTPLSRDARLCVQLYASVIDKKSNIHAIGVMLGAFLYRDPFLKLRVFTCTPKHAA